MIVDLAYNHGSGEITISFSFYNDEEAFAVGFGGNCAEAENNIRGWYLKNSEEFKNHKRFLYPKEKPFMAFLKRMKDGRVVKSSDCINVFKDHPTGSADQLTIRNIDF